MVRKVMERVLDKQLQSDLEKYRKRALELGATDAKIITSEMVLIDDRVQMKCMIPRCSRYGSNANCPPYSMEAEQTRKVVNKYHYAIFTRIERPSEEMAGLEAKTKGLYIPCYRKTYELISKIEMEAFYDGYYLAMGFACGSCKSVFCPKADCSALAPEGVCRFPMKARPSMESVGIDAFAMATKVGWDIYPIGPSISPSEVPCSSSLGLVLIY